MSNSSHCRCARLYGLEATWAIPWCRYDPASRHWRGCSDKRGGLLLAFTTVRGGPNRISLISSMRLPLRTGLPLWR